MIKRQNQSFAMLPSYISHKNDVIKKEGIPPTPPSGDFFKNLKFPPYEKFKERIGQFQQSADASPLLAIRTSAEAIFFTFAIWGETKKCPNAIRKT